MTTDDSAALETAAHDDSTALDQLDDRDRRALTECLSVLEDVGEARDAPGLYVVVGENGGGEYTADTRTGSCTCPDHEYNLPEGDRETCKHVAAARFATGQREIPAGVTPEDVRDDLGAHVTGEPRYADGQGDAVDATGGDPLVADGGIIDAGDEGVILETSTDDSDDERPEDCECHRAWHVDQLPCFACYAAGFETPNPDPDDDVDELEQGA